MMVKLQEIDFDPPPKSTCSRSSSNSNRYDIRPQHYNSFISENSSNSSDRDYVGSSLHSSFLSAIKAEVNSDHEDENGDDDDQEVVQTMNEEENRHQQATSSTNNNDELDTSIADWSNGPAILESSDKIINDNSNSSRGDLPQSSYHDVKHVTKDNNMSPSADDSADITTSNEDDYDENNSVFLSWPEQHEEQIDKQLQNQHQQQHHSNKDDESVTSERSWWRGWNGNRRRSSAASSSSIADDDQRNVVISIIKKRGSAPQPQRHSSVSDVTDSSNHSNSNNDDNNNNNNKIKSNQAAATTGNDDDDLEETLQSHYQQWWKFGIQRRGTVEPSESSFHNSCIVEDEEASNKNNHRAAADATGDDDDDDDDDDVDETLQTHYNQWWQFGVRRRGTVEPSIISSVAEEEEDSTRSSTVMINRSDNNYNSSSPENNLATARRRSMESKKSDTTSSAVDDTELNNFLFPRRGWANRQNSIQGSVIGGNDTASSLSAARTTATTASSTSPSNRPQCQNHEDILERLSKNFVNVSPIERALLNDMASTKNSNRWRNNRSSVVLSNADEELDDNHQRERRGDDGEVGDNELEQQHSSSTEEDEIRSPSNAEQGNSEIYWDSDKLCKLKQGVSLARARALDDEVSSIASSDHSGRIPLMKNIAHKRSYMFGWNNTAPISEEEEDINGDDEGGDDGGDDTPDDNTFKPEKIFPRSTASSGRLTSSRGSGRLSMSGGSGRLSMTGGRFTSSGRLTSLSSSIRPKSIISTHSKHSRRSAEYDDYDDETCDSRATEDLKHETVVREACEIMTSVNNSVVAMGMNAVFRPMEEICPPFHKLHKNLGYQMDALGAAIVRSKKSLTSDKRSERKKSKKLRASKMKNSFSPRASMGLNGSFTTMSTKGGMHDPEAMSKLIAQMVWMQSQQNSDAGSSSSNSNITQHSFFTSWLPNYMWYQSIAADTSSVMRPTSLCSGTGITGDENYLNPEMLKVFQMFSTYFVGSKHLFQEGDEDNKKSKMRRYWMETIDEEVDSDDDMSESSSSYDSEVSDESDMVYELDDSSVDVDRLVDTEKQIEILQNVIKDLRKSQMNDAHPLLSIDTLDDTKPSSYY